MTDRHRQDGKRHLQINAGDNEVRAFGANGTNGLYFPLQSRAAGDKNRRRLTLRRQILRHCLAGGDNALGAKMDTHVCEFGTVILGRGTGIVGQCDHIHARVLQFSHCFPDAGDGRVAAIKHPVHIQDQAGDIVQAIRNALLAHTFFKAGQGLDPAGVKTAHGNGQGNRILAMGAPTDFVVDFDTGPGTGGLALGGKTLGQRLHGNIGDTVDQVDVIPMHMTRDAQNNVAGIPY